MGRINLAVGFLASAVPVLPSGIRPVHLLGPATGVGAVAALALVRPRGPLELLVLAAILGLFVLAAHHRTWLALPPLLVDLTVSEVWVPALGMSLRLAVTGVAVGLAATILVRSRGITLDDPATRRVLLPTVLFIGASTVINLLFSDLGYVVKYLRYQISIALAMALLIVLVRDRRSAGYVAAAILVTAVASALVAVVQRVVGAPPWYVTEDGLPPISFGVRSLGLTESPVLAANSLVAVAVPALGLLAASWSRHLPRRGLLVLAAAIVLVGAYLTVTRSAMLAIGAGVAVIFLLVDDRRRLRLFALLVAGAAVLGIGMAAGLADERLLAGADEDASAASHVAIGQVAIAIALDNPLIGVGHEHFEDLAPAYLSVVSVGAGPQAQKEGQEAIGAFRPHNDFLEVWTSWGVVALAAYVGVMLGAFANCVSTARSSDPLIRGLGVGCAAGIVAYAVNSSFHNYLDSSAVLWAFAGFSVVLARLADQATVRRAALRARLLHTGPGRPLRRWT